MAGEKDCVSRFGPTRLQGGNAATFGRRKEYENPPGSWFDQFQLADQYGDFLRRLVELVMFLVLLPEKKEGRIKM